MNFITANQKLVAGLLLFILWTVLVFTGQSQPDDLIQGIKDALVALFGYHAITTLKGKDQ